MLAIFIYLGFYVTFSCTGHITMGSWKGRGNQYIQFVGVLYCKLPTNGKQPPAFPLQAVTGIEPPPQRWEARVLPLCHRGPHVGYITLGYVKFQCVKDTIVTLKLRFSDSASVSEEIIIAIPTQWSEYSFMVFWPLESVRIKRLSSVKAQEPLGTIEQEATIFSRGFEPKTAGFASLCYKSVPYRKTKNPPRSTECTTWLNVSDLAGLPDELFTQSLHETIKCTSALLFNIMTPVRQSSSVPDFKASFHE